MLPLASVLGISVTCGKDFGIFKGFVRLLTPWLYTLVLCKISAFIHDGHSIYIRDRSGKQLTNQWGVIRIVTMWSIIIFLGVCLVAVDAFNCTNSTCQNGGTCYADKERKSLPSCK